MKKFFLDFSIMLCVSAVTLVVAWAMQPAKQSIVISNTIETDDTVSATVNAAQKDKSFENFVVDRFDFSRDGYDLLEQNQEDVKTRTDLLVEVTGDTKIYRLAIECTWVEALSSKGLIWANETEMKSILESAEKEKDVDVEVKIILIVGVGGTPTSPKSLYIAPIKYHADRSLTAQTLAGFETKFKSNGKFNFDGAVLRLE
ncbi:MAG: hypothetical protein E7070_06875 [Bacteroidales bacterium]|jgi:hypothetical protein|nr:hypothetical protein [Bacteroidales bacterium]